MLQAKAQVVITAIPSERVVYIEFSIEIPDSIIDTLPEFINGFKGIHCTNTWNSSEYGFKVSHNRAWDCTEIANEIQTFLRQKEITDFYVQIE